VFARDPRPFTVVAIALALALVLASCSGAQNPNDHAGPLTARDYFPLHANAAWSFDSDDIDHPGTPGLITMHVVRDDGAGGFYMQQGRGAPAVYEYQGGGITRNGEMVLQGPIAAGTRWEGRSHDAYVIQRTGLTRTVMAGTFHDVVEVVRAAGDATLRNGTEYRETYYYAPHVGPIEAEVPIMLESGEVRRFRLTLRGYTLTGDF
jgi:hypothetical protein